MRIRRLQILAMVLAAALAAAPAAWAAQKAAETPKPAPAAASPGPRTCAAEAAVPEAPGPDPVAQSLRHYVRGRLLALSGEHSLAAKEFQQAVALEPKVGLAWLFLGLSLYDSGNVAEATKALDEALKLMPDNPPALYYRARVARNAGDLKRSKELLTKLENVAAKGTALRILGAYHLAQICNEQGDVDGAIAGYESLLEQIRDPQPFFQRYAELFMIYRGQLQVRETLGRLYLLRGDNEKAADIFKDILEDRPDHYEVMGLLCHAYVQQKNFKAALEVARQLMQAKPDGAEGYQRLAEVYRAEGKPEGAVADLENFRKTQPANRMLAFQLAGLYELIGRKDDAAKLYGELSVGADSSQGPSVAAALKLAELQVQAGRPVEAIEALSVAITGAPSDSAVLVRGAQLIDGLKNAAAVYQDAQRLVTDDRKNYGAFVLVGMLAETVKRRDEAIALYDKALQRQSKAAIAYSRKADLLIDAQRPADALAVYEAALKAGLDIPVFHRKMGMILEFLDRPGEAMVQYRIARQAAPDDKPTRYLLAGLLARTGEVAEAEAELRNLLARFPKEAQAYVQLAAIGLQKNDLAAADQAAGQALAAEPGLIAGRAIKAEVRFRQKKFGEAAELARGILKDRPEANDVRLLLALALAGDKKLGDAATELKTALAANPENIEWRYALAGIYAESGDPAAAEQELQRILQKKPDHAPAQNDLGYMWADRGVNMAKAEQMIRDAVKSNPQNAAYLDSLGWVMYKEGKFEEAVRVLVDATKAAPDLDAVLWDHLGDAYWRLSRQDDARKAWEAAVKILESKGEVKAGDLKRVRQKVENVQAGRAPDVAPLAPKGEPAPSAAKGASAR